MALYRECESSLRVAPWSQIAWVIPGEVFDSRAKPPHVVLRLEQLLRVRPARLLDQNVPPRGSSRRKECRKHNPCSTIDVT